MNPFNVPSGTVFLALVFFLVPPPKLPYSPWPCSLALSSFSRVMMPQVQPYQFSVGDSASLEVLVCSNTAR